MNRRNSIILGLLFLILVVEVVIFAPKELGLSPAEDQPQTAPTPAAATAAAGQIMYDAHLVEANAQGKEWELWADKALRPSDNDEWTIERVKVNFFATNGVTYTVTGKTGKVVPSTNDIRIDGNVVTRSSNGYVFKTETMLYDSKKRRLKSPKKVQMEGLADTEGGRLRLTGGEMDADFLSNEINVTKNVRAHKRIKGGQETSIQSDRAVFSGRTNQAQFFGKVVMDVDAMRVTGPEAHFAYDPKTKNIDSVKVSGGIRVTDAEKYATSSSVLVHFADDRVVFSGSPRVVQNGDELIGDEIVFLNGGKKVQVSNAKAQIDSGAMEKKN